MKTKKQAKLSLYLLKNLTPMAWNTYRDFVVVSESKEKALSIHPDGGLNTGRGFWPKNHSMIEITLIGKAEKGLKEGMVLCANYNAG